MSPWVAAACHFGPVGRPRLSPSTPPQPPVVPGLLNSPFSLSLVAASARPAIWFLVGWICYQWSFRGPACMVEVRSCFSCLCHCRAVLFVLIAVANLLALLAVQICIGSAFLPCSYLLARSVWLAFFAGSLLALHVFDEIPPC